MLKKIVSDWHCARGNVLRKEVEDSILRINGLEPETNLLICLTLADSYASLFKDNGPITNMFNDGQKTIAKMLAKKARERFNFNMGQGYGLFFLSAYVEAHALPGEDALYVKNMLHDLVQTALETAKNYDDLRVAESSTTGAQ